VRRRRLLFSALLLLPVIACSVPDGSAVVTPTLPTTSGFPYVAEVMEHRCGTLDCHGTVARNLRVYGDEGLRFAASDRPCVPAATTDTEVGQDYDSVVGLEPEEMSAVVAGHGANPDQLSMIAKPLGIESHMGGTVFSVGDDTYTCLTSWLSSATDTAACLRAMPSMICGVAPTSAFDAGVLDAAPD
jgi:hypothetical protein